MNPVQRRAANNVETKQVPQSEEELFAKIRSRVGDGTVNVHLVSHTHDDVGWLKTVDQYYTGANNSIQYANVSMIISSIITSLQVNPQRKMVYVEQAFFQDWWRAQTDAQRDVARKLVQAGQLEFANGGWCMHDEAATYYVDMIDQTTLGHQFLLSEFSVYPKVTWQIDPFGHTSTQAALLTASVGFDGIFFARIDYQDKSARQNSKSLEMIWQASPSLGATASGIFAGAFRQHYSPPSGFCFDVNCDSGSNPPIQDDPSKPGYNVPSRVSDFLVQVNDEAQYARGQNIMFRMGDDFQYSVAENWFSNLDKLIEYVNQKSNGTVNVMYSTPSQYVEYKHQEHIVWPDKQDDFMPYADGDHTYWTGYFTSRPALKRYVRTSSNLLNSLRQISAFSNNDATSLEAFSEAQGVVQHHDGVSGTSKQHVAFDYAQRMYAGADIALKTASATLQQWSGIAGLQICQLSNISLCSVSQSATKFAVLLYNPIARPRVELIRVPLNLKAAAVVDSTGAAVTAQISPAFATSAFTVKSAPYTLYFQASLPALGYATYIITTGESGAIFVDAVKVPIGSGAQDVSIANSQVQITLSGSTGFVSQLTNVVSGQTVQLQQRYSYYQSATSGGTSGAYIFRPANNSPTQIASSALNVTLVNGPVVRELRQYFVDWLQQVVRIAANTQDQQVELEYTCGEVPFKDGVGKEVISLFQTNVQTNKTWYTDSNGREMMQRIRDYRPTWQLQVHEEVAGNYYPVNSVAYINDASSQLTVLNDRAQGVASIQDGALEFMIHRRILYDDGRGVGEPLNETSYISPYPNAVRSGPGLIITGSHYLVLNTPATASATFRPLAHRIYAAPTAFYAQLDSQSISSPQSIDAEPEFTIRSFVGAALPANVELITVQPLDSEGGLQTVLIRLAHQFGVGEDPLLSKSVSVDLAALLSPRWTLVSAEERSLTNTQKYDGMSRRSFQSEHNPNAPDYDVRVTTLVGNTITISAMEVKTVKLQVQPANVAEQTKVDVATL